MYVEPPIALTSEEQKIAARTRKTRKFLCFCEHRHELLDTDFQHTGPKLSPRAWRPRAGGGDAVAGLWSRRRSGRGRADRDGQALAAGAGLSRRRATSLQSGHPVQLPDAADHPQLGQDPAGSHGRLGGARWGLRCRARGAWTPPCSAPAGARTPCTCSARPCARPWAWPPRHWARPRRRLWRTRADAGGQSSLKAALDLAWGATHGNARWAWS